MMSPIGPPAGELDHAIVRVLCSKQLPDNRFAMPDPSYQSLSSDHSEPEPDLRSCDDATMTTEHEHPTPTTSYCLLKLPIVAQF